MGVSGYFPVKSASGLWEKKTHFTWEIWDRYMILVGGFNHLEKYESQWEGLSHILWKIKHVPNHQPGCIYIYTYES